MGTFYRPVGLEEMRLIFAVGMRGFPPRLPEQPIFYPVLDEDYAAEIARDWNTKRDALVGYVTRFVVNAAYVAKFPVQTVGAVRHRELWVPAEEMDAFNGELGGRISVFAAYFGKEFRGLVPAHYSLKGLDASAQLVALCGILDYSLMDFHGELAANREAVYLHFPFWKRQSAALDRTASTLDAIRKAWPGISPEVPLPDF